MNKTAGNIPLHLPTFRIGPENMGRGYSLLAISPDLDTGAWRADLAMLMLNWAKKREQNAFSACLDLGDGTALVLRARYFRDTNIGVIAFANGAFCSKEALLALGQRTELVLEAIPPVEEQQEFGANAIALTYRPLDRAIKDSADAWAPFGMGWQPTFLKIPPDIASDEVIAQALASIRPQQLLTRNLGWATSAVLESRGKLAPYSRCRLVVSYDDAPPTLPDRFAKIIVRPNGALHGVKPDKPDSLKIWDKMTAIIDSVLDGSKNATDTAEKIAGTANHHIDPLFPDPQILASQMALIASNNMGFSKVAHMLALMRASAITILHNAANTVQERYLVSVKAAGKMEKFVSGAFAAADIHPQSLVQLLTQLDIEGLSQLDGKTVSDYLQKLSKIENIGQAAANPLYRRNFIGLVGQMEHVNGINRLHHDVIENIILLWPNDSAAELAAITGRDIIDLANTGRGDQICKFSEKLFGPIVRHTLATQAGGRAALVKNLSSQLHMYAMLNKRRA